MKVLLTGSEGLIGSHSKPTLEREHEVIGLDIQGNTDYKVNVTDFYEVLHTIQNEEPDAIIHLAAKAGSSEGGGTYTSKKDPLSFLDVNIQGTINLLEGARQEKIENFIYMSSFSTYGKTNSAIDEATHQKPDGSAYATSKFSSEIIAKTYQRCYNQKVLVFRAPLIVGEGQEEWNALNEFVDCALEDKEVEVYGDGVHQREWLWAEDVGRAYKKGLEYMQKNNFGRDNPIYNNLDHFVLGAPQNLISMKDLAHKVVEFVGKGEVVHKDVDKDTWDQWTSIKKAQGELNWRPKVSLDEIIERVVDDRR